MSDEINIEEIIDKITKEIIKDNVYDDGEINDYVLDYSLPIHDMIMDEVREKVANKRRYRFVSLVKDVLKDYKYVMDLKYSIKDWYSDADPSVHDNRNDIPHHRDVWLQNLIELFAKYGLRYEYNHCDKRHRCGNYEKMISTLTIMLEGLLINQKDYVYGFGLEEKCIRLDKVHSGPKIPKP